MNATRMVREVAEEALPLCASQETLIAQDLLLGRDSSRSQQVPLGFWITGVTEADLRVSLNQIFLRHTSLQSSIGRNP